MPFQRFREYPLIGKGRKAHRDVQPSSSDISSHHHRRFVLLELVQGLEALPLLQGSVQAHNRQVEDPQNRGQPPHCGDSIGEDQSASRMLSQQVVQPLVPVFLSALQVCFRNLQA